MSFHPNAFASRLSLTSLPVCVPMKAKEQRCEGGLVDSHRKSQKTPVPTSGLISCVVLGNVFFLCCPQHPH